MHLHHLGETPTRFWVFDNAVEIVPSDAVPRASWDQWVRYDNPLESRKRTSRQLDALSYEVRSQIAALRSSGSIAQWCERLGYAVIDDPTLHGGGLHVTSAGGSLATHLDYSRHPVLPYWKRALNLIAFVHDDWRSEWGGELVLTSPNNHVVQTIAPLPRRLVAFETNDLSYHGVRPTREDAPDRVSLAVYFLTPATPADTRERALFIPPR